MYISLKLEDWVMGIAVGSRGEVTGREDL